jgi:putative flippase GtrA
MRKKDFLMAGIAGFLTAFFILPTLKNIKIIQIEYLVPSLLIGLPILWMLAIAVGRLLGRWLSWIYQFVKFCVVGFLNAAIDFGVLNLLSLYTGLTSGFIIGGVNVPGFVIAATNSYFWNKFWVFSHKRKEGEPVNYSDIPTFILVVVSGIIVNSGLVVLISTYIPPFFDLSAARWLNVAKVIASAIALLWNFLGFKFFVFKSKEIKEQ